MKKNLPFALMSLGFFASSNQSIYAKAPEKCPVPAFYNHVSSTEDIFSLPVFIEADKLDAIYPKEAIYSGNVIITQGKRKLNADLAKVEQINDSNSDKLTQIVSAIGNVEYEDPQIRFLASDVKSNINTKEIFAQNGEYNFQDRYGRGTAESILSHDGKSSTVINGSFTACPPGDNSWKIRGKKIFYDDKKKLVEIKHATFEIANFPVFYLPYFQYPTTDERRSGLLLPSYRYSENDGFEFILPYYWNIAPNYDFTFTPRIITHRGIKLDNEFRYLLDRSHSGTIAFDWLKDDRVYKKDYAKDNDPTRWLLYWRHNGRFDNGIYFSSDYTKVSDNRYFSDFLSKYGSSTDGYASQLLNVGYSNNHWNARLSTSQFQVFDSNITSNYESKPQFDVFYDARNYESVNLKNHFQVTKFENQRINYPDVTRFHFEPSLDYSYQNFLGRIDSSARLYLTHYKQDLKNNKNPLLEESVTRTIPSFKVKASTVLERDTVWLKDYTQTLEPEIQYLFTDYKDQSNIQNIDSVLLPFNYQSLSRNKIFSGIDRISSANQITIGATTRLFDELKKENFNFSFGQIFYFEPEKTTYLDEDKVNQNSRLTYNLFWNVIPNLNLETNVQYDYDDKNVLLGDAMLEYRINDNNLLQFSYRYASESYISMLDLYSYSLYNKELSQFGFIGSYQLTDSVSLYGGYHYDNKVKKSTDEFIGLEYNSCCWGIDITYGRFISEWNNLSQQSVYDHRFSVHFMLRGISGSDSKAMRLLNAGKLPYQNVFPN